MEIALINTLTNLMLIIAAFTSDLTKESVRQSIKAVKMTEIKSWSIQNVGISLFEKRKALLVA